MPPATIRSEEPAASASAAIIAAFMPEPHILLIGGRLGRLGQAGAERGLAGRGLAEAGGEDAAHVAAVDIVRVHAGALDRGPDGGGAELGRGGAGEAALERAHRGAGVGEDDDGVGWRSWGSFLIRPATGRDSLERQLEEAARGCSAMPDSPRSERRMWGAHSRAARLVQTPGSARAAANREMRTCPSWASISNWARWPMRSATRRGGSPRDRIAPLAAKIDAEDWFPTELWPEMGALGLHGITVSEEDGGLGLGYLEHVVAQEEVARASASIGLSYGAHSNLCVNQIRRWASAEQKAKYLPKLISRRACREPRHVRGRGGLRRGRR